MQVIYDENIKDNFLEIAVITNSHGMDGKMKLKSFSDDILKYDKFYEYKNGMFVLIDIKIISEVQNSKELYIVEMPNVNTKLDAEKLKRKTIYISKEQLDDIDDGYYIVDLIGMTAYDELGEKLGEVTNVETNLSYEMFVINTGKKEICIPNIKEYVIEINTSEKIAKFNVEKLRNIF